MTDSLSKRFGRARLAVDSVSLEVSAGEICALVGPNGAGKTTFLRSALRLTQPTSGRSTILGHDMSSNPRAVYSQVGVMIEEPLFFPHLSGRENLQQVGRLYGTPLTRIDEMLALVGLGDRGRDKVKTYSMGMRQRLGIARALLPDPRLLLLDEPTNGLDPPGMREVRDLLRRLADEGRAMIVSSHLLGELELFADRIAVLQDGKLMADAPIADYGRSAPTTEIDVSDAPRASELVEANLANLGVSAVRTTGTGTISIEIVEGDTAVAAERTNKLLVEAGVGVSRLQPHARSLEDRFLTELGDSSPPEGTRS
ncbi:MAG: ABC transporter ATP-binding protein [Thermoleophilia bacterium]|nr:ABC transporter ATP-binding protein [Thermoleophilia bacterium]